MKLKIIRKKFKVLFAGALFFLAFNSYAQLKPDSKVFLTFVDIENEVNVDAEDAKGMLKSYLNGKTSLVIVDSIQSTDFVLRLSIIEKNMGKRKGKLDVLDNQTTIPVFESNWVKGSMNAFYGYSGSRHAIGRLIKKELLGAFPDIEVEE